MTLLITILAAVAVTVIWYSSEKARRMKVDILMYMFWGASLMWLIDAVFEYAELHEAFFAPAPVDMLNDLYLGLSVVALGLIIWLVILLVKDPDGIVRASLLRKKN